MLHNQLILVGLLPYGYTPYKENGDLKPDNQIDYSIREHACTKTYVGRRKISKKKR